MPQIIVLLIGLLLGCIAALAVYHAMHLRNRLTKVMRAVGNFVEVIKQHDRYLQDQSGDIRSLRRRVLQLENVVASRDLQQGRAPVAEDDDGEVEARLRLDGMVTFWERLVSGDDDDD